jgi:ketol-acid reductoisomerase
MTTIFHDGDADLGVLDGRSVAVVGYGNQGRSWALNLRDSGLDVTACVRNDDTRTLAEADGFATQDVEAASASWRLGCWGRRCGAATRRGSGSSRRSASTAT